ncbi:MULTISPECIES: Rieske 2Fe-2S domain-containing protein [unclassified Streptomyces]|uniref:Rieske 2Fe-2S domain-containing protein n=1 Tax=unclassified Streptomyces TaxID=2593676 RepID=UPI003803893B
MLSAEDNRRLTEVDRGAPMGELLRRYWHPVAAAADFTGTSVKPLRILGEDLVLFKDAAGEYGLIQRQCPHRLADLAHGFVDGGGLRCNYHGWLFDKQGACTAQPFEDLHGDSNAKLKERTRATAYAVRELAGLLWAYLGPAPAPELPRWEPFTWRNGFSQIVFAHVPCNWFQCQENSIDPVHFEWLHDNWGATVLRGKGTGYSSAHLKLEFEEFDYGHVYRRIREGFDETHELWTVGRVCLWPNALFTGDHFEWRVPIDNENTLSVSWMFERVPESAEPFEQKEIPAWTGPVSDPETGRYYTDHLLNQDFVAWLGQGRIADRTRENLGRSDRGITMLRRRFLSELKAIERGEDPKGLIRDPKDNDSVALPIANRDMYVKAPTPRQLGEQRRYWAERGIPGPYIYQYGQPADVRDAYDEVMGATGDGA